MTDEEIIKDYPRLKLEYTRLHEDFRRIQSKQLNLACVTQRRELLLDFILFDNKNKPERGKCKRPTERVSDFLKSNNSG